MTEKVEFETEDKNGPKKDSDEIGKQKDKQKAYKVQGNLIILHGKSK